MDKQRYTLKYQLVNHELVDNELIDNEYKKCTKLTVFNDLDKLLGFMINVSFLCDPDDQMTVYNKETKKLIIKGYPSDILKHFKPELSEDELVTFFDDNLLDTTIKLIKNNILDEILDEI